MCMVDTDYNNLYNGDCLNIMRTLIADGQRFSAIITSPPYNMCLKVQGNKYVSRWAGKHSNKNHLSNKYNNYLDDMPMEKYEQFLDDFLALALQLTDYVFFNIQLITGNKIALLHILGKYAEKIKDIIIWNKDTAEPAINKGMLNSQFEFIICFSNTRPKCRTFDNALFSRGTMSNVWTIRKERNNNIKAGFPRELVARIVNNFTSENDSILDPFMGSGTTGVVCYELGRKFTGIELDESMFNIAKQRIVDATKKQTLF